jgi:hypothetical protein
MVWSGIVRFDDAGLWFDARPPAAAQGRGDMHEAAPEPTPEVASGDPGIANLALWTGPGSPDGVQCWDTATMHGVSQIHVKVGDVVCAKTVYRQVAVVKIVAIPADFSGIRAVATVWGGGTPSGSPAA